MKYFFTGLLFLSLNSQADEIPLTSKQLDQMITKACMLHSEEAKCVAKISQVQKGMSATELLLKAPALPIDEKIQVTVINDPAILVSQYYCLAIYNNVVALDQISPDIFPYVVYGLSYNESSIPAYKKWLKSHQANPCKNALKKIGFTPAEIPGNKAINIILNPLTFLEDGAEDFFYDSAVRNYNHERLHAIYALNNAKNKTVELWKTLTKDEKEQFKKEHPSYNFLNTDVLYREFFSYIFEASPFSAYEFLAQKSKPNYAQVKKSTCKWCVSGNQKIIEEIKTASQLSPKDLIAKLEAENIKILILSSGRKNPSKFFSWGQIRQDKGELSQISKLEGAMGKTLCKNELPEAKDTATIVVASDSPYSTLIHEYIHILQIRSDPSWCAVSKRLWTDQPSQSEIHMVRDREWDARLVLWELLNGSQLNNQMNIEDQIIISEGLLREGAQRNSFDSNAALFLKKNKIQEYFNQKVSEYKK